MLKIPFIEHTGVGIEITSEEVRWMEVDRIGKKWSLKSSGEFSYTNGEASLLNAMDKLKEELQADAYKVGVALPESLLEVLIEEVPYSEEEEESERWIIQKEKEILRRYASQEVILQHHTIQVDEDNKRCIFQVFDEHMVERYSILLSEKGIYPQYISSGLLEAGYAQCYNSEFVDGVSSVLHSVHGKFYLSIFESGLIRNLYELSQAEEFDLKFTIQECDSYLQTEETSTDQQVYSIPLFVAISQEGVHLSGINSERSVIQASPLKGKKGFEEITQPFVTSSGVLTRLFYSDLDGFNIQRIPAVERGVLIHDKKETIRLGILLFVPLIFFGLLTYAFGKVVDYRLVESNQIIDQIGDKIEEVTAKRAQLIDTRDRFLDTKSMLDGKEAVAYILENIGRNIPKDLWLVSMTSEKLDAKGTQVTISGYSSSDAQLSSFLNELEDDEFVEKAQLVVSEKIEATRPNRSQPVVALIGTTRFELQIHYVQR